MTEDILQFLNDIQAALIMRDINKKFNLSFRAEGPEVDISYTFVLKKDRSGPYEWLINESENSLERLKKRALFEIEMLETTELESDVLDPS